MRDSILCLPVVLAAVGLGACSPPAEEPGGGGHVVPSGGGSGNTGGSVSTAGSTSGGNSTGGMSGSGGTDPGTGGTGGETTGGSGGSSGGTGGSGGGSGGPEPTAGCGKAATQALGEYVQHTVMITGATLGEPDAHMQREIFVRLPETYDPNTPYRVVYITVGCGASGIQGYPLFAEQQGGDPNAIYVGLARPDPDPDPPSLAGCYDNRGGVDSIEWESLEKDHAFVSENFCVDNKKVYTAGYSSGGWMSNMYSCYFAGIPDPPRTFMPNVALRGAMAVAGCFIPENPPCQQLPVGGLWIHDESEVAPNAYSCATAQRDRVLQQNGCADGADGPTEVWGEDFMEDGQCLKYTNCSAAYPVIFCSTTGYGHGSQDQHAIPAFTRMVQEMEAAAP